MPLRRRDWAMLAAADIDPATVAAITGQPVAEVERCMRQAEQNRRPAHTRATRPERLMTPILAREDWQRSGWGCRLPAG